ncbi:MAG TPA: cytochrome C oxidase subunit IV family protein [Cyclobacteriaceae bacterium]
MDNQSSQVTVKPVDKSKIRKLIRVAVILGVVTLIEFAIAFTIAAGAAKTFLFVALTIVKAFYIVGEFMHLTHERKTLIWSILLPMIFVVFMLFVFMFQGGSIFKVKYF